MALQVAGVSRIETIKYGLESRGTQKREGLRWRGPAETVNYRSILSTERALQKRNSQLSKENFKEKKKLVTGLRWGPDTKTDWPTDCRSYYNSDLADVSFETQCVWGVPGLSCSYAK
jgi:hypothetical protein